MIIGKELEIFEVRVREDKELGYVHGETVRMAGEQAVIEGFEDFRFAVDLRFIFADRDGLGIMEPDLYEPAWYVTELTTGMQVCMPQDTKEEAIAEAKRILDLKGVDKLRAAIAKGLEMVGAA